MRRHGVRCSAAAKLRRRAGVSSASPTTPMTRARLCERKPSSMAHRASPARAVSANSQDDGSRPRAAKPCPYGAPSSRAKHGRPAPQDARRTCRRSFDALQTAHGEAQGKAERRRPIAGSANSRCLRFGLHLVQGGGIEAAAKTLIDLGGAERPQAHCSPCAASSGEEEEAMREEPRSSAMMRVRSSASTPALLSCRAVPPGTARRDSPFRFGQERLGPTLRNPLRGHALGPGSGREIRCRRPDGGVGDGAVWSTGTLSLQPTRRQLECRLVLFLF